MQDDSSIQIALMVALLRGRTPRPLRPDRQECGARVPLLRATGEETLPDTARRAVATVIYTSRKANSPRVNRYWCAPERGYIPLRVQQKRGDEVEWTMEILSLKRE